MSITIQVERLSPLIETELWPLLQAHREELSTNKALMQLAPIAKQYRAAEEAGSLFCLTVRDEAGALKGYSANFIGPHLHYSGLRYVHNDVLFLEASVRRGRNGYKLILATEQAARERGAKMIIWHAKMDTALNRMLPGLGYRIQDVMYSKEL